MDLCQFIGCDVVGDENYLLNFGNIIRMGLNIIFGAIIVYGIFIIIKAVYKIVGSEGDAGKVESGLNSIKGVYIGIVMIFVGLIGLVILFALFNITELPGNPGLPGSDEGPVINDPFN